MYWRPLAAALIVAAGASPSDAFVLHGGAPLLRGHGSASLNTCLRKASVPQVSITQGATISRKAASPSRLRMSTGGGGLAGSGDDDEDGKDEAGIFDNMMDSPLYRSDDGSRDSEFGIELGNKAGGKKPDAYATFLATYAPGEMVGQFMATAPPRVQAAVKQTVLGLLGSLRTSAAYDSNIVTTKNALASLMFQLELTGYMFRNAEYRLGLSQSLSKGMLGPAEDESNTPKVSGEIQVKMGDQEIKIDAESYVSELRREVENLRNELVSMKQKQAGQEAQDLLAYVQRLEEEEMKSLTEGVSPEVLGTMRSLVETVVQGMGGELSA